MNKAELEHIQAACREWLLRSDSSEDHLTIPAGGALSRAIEIKLSGLLTFDNVVIRSAVDSETGVCYATLVRQPDGLQEVFVTPFEKITEGLAAPTSDLPVARRETQRRLQEAMAQANQTRMTNVNKLPIQPIDPSPPWIEKGALDYEERAKYLLLTNGKLLGYSFLERQRAGKQRSGRFHPEEDYFEFAEIFASFPQAENDCMEINAREAYGLSDENAGEYRDRFYELSDRIDALKLYLADSDEHPIETTEVRLEDLSRHYDDDSERWLYVSFSN